MTVLRSARWPAATEARDSARGVSRTFGTARRRDRRRRPCPRPIFRRVGEAVARKPKPGFSDAPHSPQTSGHAVRGRAPFLRRRCSTRPPRFLHLVRQSQLAPRGRRAQAQPAGAGPSALVPAAEGAQPRQGVRSPLYEEARALADDIVGDCKPRAPGDEVDRVASRAQPRPCPIGEVAGTSTAVPATRARGCERCASPAAGRAYTLRRRRGHGGRRGPGSPSRCCHPRCCTPVLKKLREQCGPSPTPTPPICPSTQLLQQVRLDHAAPR